MDVRVVRALCIALLAAAIAAVLASVSATRGAARLQGPAALLVTPAGDEVWLAVDQALWRIAPDGRLRQSEPIAATGLPGAPANLVRHPQGSIVASVRGDATLYVLDGASGRVTERRQLQWPAELQPHSGRAINFAFDDDGAVAVATGGGHTVALFDRDGRFLSRTQPGLYEFSNGLWWTPEGLWTTDTNRFTLRLLDRRTLAELRAVDLGSIDGTRFLGPARGLTRSGNSKRPMAALIRFEADMNTGGVSLIDAGGRARALSLGSTAEPRDLDWLGDQLLMSDGGSFEVLRWTADGRALPPFGDAEVRQRLRERLQERDALRAGHRRWLLVAGAALGLGLLAAVWASMLTRRPASTKARLDLSHLGTPQLDPWSHAKLGWRSHGWLLAAGLALLPLQALPAAGLQSWLKSLAPAAFFGVLACFGVLMTALACFAVLRQKRLAREPRYEPIFNARALALLKSGGSTVASSLRAGEQVLEAFCPLPGRACWVLTNQRLLSLAAGLFEHRVGIAHELKDVRSASNEPGGAVRKGFLRRRSARQDAWLEISLRGGHTIEGTVGSSALARRVIERILALSSQAQGRPRQRSAAAVPRFDRARRWRRAWASALLPGLGQWLQRRTGEAALFMSLWLAVLLFGSAPALWTLIEPYTHVGLGYALIAGTVHALLSLLAAVDAWQGDPLALR